MSENRILDAAASDEVGYRDPEWHPPPGGVKLLLLTEGGVAVIGTWADGAGFVAWSYLPKRAVRGAAQPSAEPICRADGRCQYAIDSGAEGMGHCPTGKCAMKPSAEPVADAAIKAAYVAAHGTDKGWLGLEGSYFISGYAAAQPSPQGTQEQAMSDINKIRRAQIEAAERAVIDSLPPELRAIAAAQPSESKLRAELVTILGGEDWWKVEPSAEPITHRPGCPALGGYGTADRECICGAAQPSADLEHLRALLADSVQYVTDAGLRAAIHKAMGDGEC